MYNTDLKNLSQYTIELKKLSHKLNRAQKPFSYSCDVQQRTQKTSLIYSTCVFACAFFTVPGGVKLAVDKAEEKYHATHANLKTDRLMPSVSFYRLQTKLRKGNVLHLSVSHSVHRGRGCLPQCMLGYTLPSRETPPRQTLLRAETPLPSACWDTYTPAQCMLG